MATYTADLFMTLDGFGSGTEAYWGKDGPELREERARAFSGEDQALVFGATSYRMTEKFMPEEDDPSFRPLKEAQKIVISSSLEEPLTLPNTTLVRGDAVEVVPQLKADSSVPLRGHGSISMNRALLAAGLVDRLEVIVFPIINGATGDRPLFADLPDIDLELVESNVFDGKTQQLIYVPSVRW